MPNGERLPRGTEENLLVRDEPGRPDGMNAHAVYLRTARTCQLVLRSVGHCGRPSGRAGLADDRGRASGSAAWRVDLIRMVHLNDLDRIEEPGRPRGELHHQDRADREVR